eukprot:m.1455482 g.1455482  ORF g.1455482 m.1455482 type:complete len:123 (+) comp25120_c0_seq39:1258-1626(+)
MIQGDMLLDPEAVREISNENLDVTPSATTAQSARRTHAKGKGKRKAQVVDAHSEDILHLPPKVLSVRKTRSGRRLEEEDSDHTPNHEKNESLSQTQVEQVCLQLHVSVSAYLLELSGQESAW